MHKRLFIAAALAIVLALAAFSYRRVATELNTPFNVAASTYETSQSCKGCHPAKHASWYRTFHRTMTQNASKESVQGDFSDKQLVYQGVVARFFREGDAFMMEMRSSDGQQQRHQIVRTVGSRRVQQYVTKIGDRHFRLPLAWNIEEKRWFHLNGGFLNHDDTPYDEHISLWDGNCIFCHNTKANPGFNWNAKTFDSHVEELGIACEACHGPGEEHAKRNSNPLRRYVLHYTERRDPTIIDPKDLPKLEQVQICGHCHGQRLPNPTDRIREFMSSGDPYTPGENLETYVAPLQRHSILPGVNIEARFWNDGTPRLTAYEYQSLLMTPDFQKGGLTCISCHEAHGGDPRGMITEEMRGPAACSSCHASIVKNAVAHSKHRVGSSGTDCYACHMPKITYGLLDVHPTHRISNPDPSRAWRYDMPEACTLCHTDKSAKWAASELARQYGKPPVAPPADASDLAENMRAMFAGDPVQRSVAAMAFGDKRSYTSSRTERLWAVPLLLGVMRHDGYPAIRLFAWRSLRELVRSADAEGKVRSPLGKLPPFDFQGTKEERSATLDAWDQWWVTVDKSAIRNPGAQVLLDERMELREDVARELQSKQQNATISIGE